MTKLLLLGIPDLAFSARVNSVARSNGVPAIAVFTRHDLLSKAHWEDADLCILDLSASQYSPEETIAEMRGDEHTKHITIIGFNPIYDATFFATMEKAGCSMVLSRDQLVQNLDAIVKGSLRTAAVPA